MIGGRERKESVCTLSIGSEMTDFHVSVRFGENDSIYRKKGSEIDQKQPVVFNKSVQPVIPTVQSTKKLIIRRSRVGRA